MRISTTGTSVETQCFRTDFRGASLGPSWGFHETTRVKHGASTGTFMVRAWCFHRDFRRSFCGISIEAQCSPMETPMRISVGTFMVSPWDLHGASRRNPCFHGTSMETSIRLSLGLP